MFIFFLLFFMLQDTANRDESLAGPTSKMTYFAEAIQKADEPTAAELALQAGRSYVLLPKKSLVPL